jgi:hypothetical protein
MVKFNFYIKINFVFFFFVNCHFFRCVCVSFFCLGVSWTRDSEFYPYRSLYVLLTLSVLGFYKKSIYVWKALVKTKPFPPYTGFLDSWDRRCMICNSIGQKKYQHFHWLKNNNKNKIPGK